MASADALSALQPRDVAELPAEGNGRFVAADDADLQAAWPSAAWHIQGPPLLPVRWPVRPCILTMDAGAVSSVDWRYIAHKQVSEASPPWNLLSSVRPAFSDTVSSRDRIPQGLLPAPRFVLHQ